MDIYLNYGEDLILNQNGDIQQAYGWDEVSQKLVRDLLTQPAELLPNGEETAAEYFFHPEYGLGLKQFLGHLAQPEVLSTMRAKCLEQIGQDSAIAISPPPIVFFKVLGAFAVQLYIDVTMANNQPGRLAIQIDDE